MKKLAAAVFAATILLLSGCAQIPGKNSETASEKTRSSSEQDAIIAVKDFKIQTAEYVYEIPESQRSDGIYNIVRRARQMCEIQWTPQSDVQSWENEFVFEKNIVCFGLPYGQPVYAKYVPWYATFGEFRQNTDNSVSVFYTERSEYNCSAPFYSCDCSAFVSWAWNLPERKTSLTIENHSSRVSGQTLDDIKVGDCLLRKGDNAHVVLITGIRLEGDHVTFAEISECTLPQTRVTRYGDGEVLKLEDLKRNYLDDGYVIMRPNNTSNIVYTHDCAVPLDGECCSNCDNTVYRHKFSAEVDGEKIKISGYMLSSEKIKNFTYRVDRRDYGSERWIVGKGGLNFRKSPSQSGEKIKEVVGGTKIIVLEKSEKADGLWGKIRFEGTLGWVWLGSSKYVSGTLEQGSEIDIKVKTNGVAPSDFSKYSQGEQGFEFLLNVDDVPSDGAIITICAYTDEGVAICKKIQLRE